MRQKTFTLKEFEGLNLGGNGLKFKVEYDFNRIQSVVCNHTSMDRADYKHFSLLLENLVQVEVASFFYAKEELTGILIRIVERYTDGSIYDVSEFCCSKY